MTGICLTHGPYSTTSGQCPKCPCKSSVIVAGLVAGPVLLPGHMLTPPLPAAPNDAALVAEIGRLGTALASAEESLRIERARFESREEDLGRRRVMAEQARDEAEARATSAEERAREAERRADFLAALAGKAIVWATLDPLEGEAPAEPADHALLASVWGLVQARAAAESALSEERAKREEAEALAEVGRLWKKEGNEAIDARNEALLDLAASRAENERLTKELEEARRG